MTAVAEPWPSIDSFGLQTPATPAVSRPARDVPHFPKEESVEHGTFLRPATT